MRTIQKEELKHMLDTDRKFKLVFCLGKWYFDHKRIPGSICIDSCSKVKDNLNPGEDIVVYCSNPDCKASVIAYNKLLEQGYTRVMRYEGGIEEWENAGLPIEGENSRP